MPAFVKQLTFAQFCHILMFAFVIVLTCLQLITVDQGVAGGAILLGIAIPSPFGGTATPTTP